jgi:hypothetical protein
MYARMHVCYIISCMLYAVAWLVLCLYFLLVMHFCDDDGDLVFFYRILSYSLSYFIVIVVVIVLPNSITSIYIVIYIYIYIYIILFVT